MVDMVKISMGIQWDIKPTMLRVYLIFFENGRVSFLAMLVGICFDPALQPNSSKSSKVPVQKFHDSIDLGWRASVMHQSQTQRLKFTRVLNFRKK